MDCCWIPMCLFLMILLTSRCQARTKTMHLSTCPSYKWEEVDDNDEYHVYWNGGNLERDPCKIRFEAESDYSHDWELCFEAKSFQLSCESSLKLFKGISPFTYEDKYSCNQPLTKKCYDDRHAFIEIERDSGYSSNIHLVVTANKKGSTYGDYGTSAIRSAVLTVGAIIGIVVAVIVCLVVCCIIVVCCCMKSRGNRGTVYRQPAAQTAAGPTTMTYNYQQQPAGAQPAGYGPPPQGQPPIGQSYPMGTVPPQPGFQYGQPSNPGVMSAGMSPSATHQRCRSKITPILNVLKLLIALNV
ncbi:hypothetical protein ScPMuIL_008725 [Solemya velum]